MGIVVATAAAGNIGLGLVDAEDVGGGGGGIVEIDDISLLFVNVPIAGDDVADRLPFGIPGDDDDGGPVPLVTGTTTLSDSVTVEFVSEFIFGESCCCSTTGRGGGGGGGSSSS